ncbi:AI-2E family transporter [Herbiconiux sp. CPCC 205763]|uniref:AI-2E family transporter n=1 Tax=Herbiconiux aconitum TaxID=2970913 RepID=A0ABT2GTZ3_9MICO|nr:AI-2E family transporter [Herbiconiux aconitum]MCS5719675.1 AI-2E family transporter [Herbiconiux aconitum]
MTDSTESRSPYPRGAIILVGLASAVVVAIGISSLRGILAPVLLTLILTICASPVRTGLEKHGVPRGLATGAVILVVFGLLAAFTYTILIAFSQFVSMLPDYASQFQQIGQAIGSWLTGLGIDQAQIQDIVKGIDPGNIAAAVSGALGSVAGITGALVIVLTMMILMAADAVYAKTILGQLKTRKPALVAAITSYTSNVRRYMVVTTVLGIVQGVLDTIALVILQVPAALLWGLLAFLMSFIPNIGYFFAIIPPVIFGFLVGGWPTVIAIVIVYGIINAVVQSIIQPRVVGQAVSLSQTITFFSVLFWAVVIGPIGAILAVPLTLLGKMILIDANPDAQWWRPVLGPTAETRGILQSDYVEEKTARKSAKAQKAALAGRRGAAPPAAANEPAPDEAPESPTAPPPG